MQFFTVYLLYTFLSFFTPVWAAEYHGARLELYYSRPKAPDLNPEEEKADRLLSSLLWEFTHPNNKISFMERQEQLKKEMAHLKQFPKVLKLRADDMVATIKACSESSRFGIPSLLELLAINPSPDLIPLFESHLKDYDMFGDKTFPSSAGLGAIYKANPKLATEERKEFLFEILNAKDMRDLNRLHLRQNLPKDLVEELDEQVYVWQTATRPKNAYSKARKKTTEIAELWASHAHRSPAEKALALQVLLETGFPPRKLVPYINEFLKKMKDSANEKPEKIDLDDSLMMDSDKEKLRDFVDRTNKGPRGLGLVIHDGIQIENLLTLARKKGLELDSSLVKEIQDLTEKQFNAIWNSGQSLVRYQGGSALSSYAQAAMLLSRGDSELSPVFSAAMQNLHDLRNEINPHTGLPRLYNYTSQAERKDATPASSAGRAMTSHLAFYERASASEKPKEAQALLQAARNFENHFSQLFELPDHDFRTHDRHPSGEGMAAYYGFGNVPYAVEALVQLKDDPSLSRAEKIEVQRLSLRIKNRLLNLMREKDSFTDNIDYNFLTVIALERLERTLSTSKEK